MKRSAPPGVASIGAPGSSGVIYLARDLLYGASAGKPFYLIYWIWTILLEPKYYASNFFSTPPNPPPKKSKCIFVEDHPFHINLSRFERQCRSGWNNPYLSGAQVIQRRFCTKHPFFKTGKWKLKKLKQKTPKRNWKYKEWYMSRALFIWKTDTVQMPKKIGLKWNFEVASGPQLLNDFLLLGSKHIQG